jgi:hypothetical protein
MNPAHQALHLPDLPTLTETQQLELSYPQHSPTINEPCFLDDEGPSEPPMWVCSTGNSKR